MFKRAVSLAFLFLVVVAGQAFGQTDPGVRGGSPAAGHPLPTVASNDPAPILSFFDAGQDDFAEVETVPEGLGPRFNSRSCGACHAQPALGGSSPAVNPQVEDATAEGARNTVPSFVTLSGPVREARFIYFNTNGVPDRTRPHGGVETLYTVTGRSDAGPCTLSQPNFAQNLANNNVIFRIPTPVFGAGLIENVDDAMLLANQAAQAGNSFGISGTFNHNGNDGTISRFGWKAQNKSLLIFSGEAYNVEMGVTNELFPQERPLPREDMHDGLPANCRLNPTPEDHINYAENGTAQNSGAQAFVNFMRLLGQPVPANNTASINNGRSLFSAVGCAVCHTPILRTAKSSFTLSLHDVNVHLFSDLQIHHMGADLADNISQGSAGGDQFRTAPLWGVGQRIFFLHDGRTRNLLTAIAAHKSAGSEANGSGATFNNLSPSQKQDILNFLRSL
ncbi:MAG: di-heme oxidoredictase family protein [Thermoanaerobaculia bacterium]